MPSAPILASAPVSWGVDFAGHAGNPPWQQVLDGIAAAGIAATELGPLGYLPEDAGPELERRGLQLTGGFIFEPLHDPAQRARTVAVAERTARRVARLGGAVLVIIDLVSDARAATAGRPDVAPRLGARERDALLATIDAVARVARRAGLRALVHPHAGSYIEFEDEIEPVLRVAELCLDSGHLAYAGIDPGEAFRRWGAHVPYLHLKDLDRSRIRDGFWDAVRDGAFRPLGEGDVDLPALLATLHGAAFAGVAVIEQDRTPGGDPVADLIASRRHLEELGCRV